MSTIDKFSHTQSGCDALFLMPDEVAGPIMATLQQHKGIGPNILQRVAGRARADLTHLPRNADGDETIFDGLPNEMPDPRAHGAGNVAEDVMRAVPASWRSGEGRTERALNRAGIRTPRQRRAIRTERALAQSLEIDRRRAAREAAHTRAAGDKIRAREAEDKAKEAATVPERLSGMSRSHGWTHSEMQDHAINALRSGRPEDRATARSLAAQMVREKNPNVTEPQLLDEVAKMMERWEGHAAEDAAENRPHREIGHGSWYDRAVMAHARGAHGARDHIMRRAGMDSDRQRRAIERDAIHHSRRPKWHDELPTDDTDHPHNAVVGQYPKLSRAPITKNPNPADSGLPIKSLLRNTDTIHTKARRVLDPDLQVMDGVSPRNPARSTIGATGVIGEAALPDAEIDGDDDGFINDNKPNQRAAPPKVAEHMQSMLASPLHPGKHRPNVPGSTTGQTLHDWSLARVTRKYGPEHGAQIHQNAMEKLTPYWEGHLAKLQARGVDINDPNAHRALIATVLRTEAARHFEKEGRATVANQRLAPMEDEVSDLRKAITQISKTNKKDPRVAAAKRRIAELESQMDVIRGQERRTTLTRGEVQAAESAGRGASLPGREPPVGRVGGSGVSDPTGDTAVAGADAEALLNEDRRAVRAAISKLPVNQRRAVEMAYFEELPQAEAAKRLGMNRNTYASHLSRGLQALKVSLAARKDALHGSLDDRLAVALGALADEYLADSLIDEYAIKALIDREPRVVRVLGTTLPVRSLRDILAVPHDGGARMIDAKAFALGVSVTNTKSRLASLAIPGSESMMRNPVRHVAISAVTPGGNAPGPNVIGGGIGGGGVGGGGLGGQIAQPVSRLVHCPAGYQNGGRFSNRKFTNCGQQLFEPPGEATPADAAPGPTRKPLEVTRTIVNATGASAGALNGAGEYTKLSATMSRAADVPHVGAANTGRSDSAVTTAVQAAIGQPAGFARLVRRDGVALDSRVGLQRLAEQRRNVDMEGGTLVSRIGSPTRIGEQEMPVLFNTGIRSVRFVTPGGHQLWVEQRGDLAGSERAKLRREWGRIQQRTDAVDGSAALQQLAQASNGKLVYGEQFNDLKNPNELVQVEQNGVRRTVPRWIHEAFLAESAPGRAAKTNAWSEVGTITAAPGSDAAAIATPRTLADAATALREGNQLAEVPSRYRADLLRQKKLFTSEVVGNGWTVHEQTNGDRYLAIDRPTSSALADKVGADLQRAFGVDAPDALLGGSGSRRTSIVGTPDSVVPGGKLAAGRGLADAAPADLARIALTDFLLGEDRRSPGSIALVGDGTKTVPVPMPTGSALLAGGPERRPTRAQLAAALTRDPDVMLTRAESASWVRPFVSNPTTSVRESISAMYDNLIESASSFDWKGYTARLSIDGDLSGADKQHLEVIRALVSARADQLRANRQKVLRALGASA